MAFSIAIDKRLSAGHRRGMIFSITDAQSAGSNGKTELRKARRIMATNTTDNADTFKEKEVVATEGTVVLTPVTDDDDGKMMVLGW